MLPGQDPKDVDDINAPLMTKRLLTFSTVVNTPVDSTT
jgi:hypothetical protein